MSTKPIVYIEKDKSWLFDGSLFTPCTLSEAKNYQVGGSIPLTTLQVGNFKFSSSLSETELEIQTEIKMYDEAGLNSELDYEITSVKHVLETENSTIVEAFSCAHDIVNETYENTVKKIGVVDWIIPSFISYASYYSIEGNIAKTDLFYYLGEDEAYAVLFQNGKYIAHRRTLSLEQIAKEIGVDTQRCRNFLAKNGLIEEKYSEEESVFLSQLQLSLSKQMEKFVHTINHKRGIFGLEGIDRLFVDFEGNSLDGLEAIFSAYGMDDVEIHTLDSLDEAKTEVNRFLKAKYIFLCANELCGNALNLSPYERQPSWYKRHVGHLAFVSTAALLLAIMHPSYFYINNMILDDKIQKLESNVKAVEAKTSVLSEKLKRIKVDLTSNKEKVRNIQIDNKVYQVTLDTLPVLMNARYVRQQMMNDAVDILKKYKLSALALDQNSTYSMNIHVIADYTKRDSIAKFMKKWMQTGYKEARTNEIYLDENIYESKIEVLR